MTLDNETVLRGFLSHLQAKVRQLADLHFERNNHPDAEELRKANPEMAEAWAVLMRDIPKVLGVEASLKHFHELTAPGGFEAVDLSSCRDPFRVRMGVLKKMADKARRKDPAITLLKSWNFDAKIRYTEAQLDAMRAWARHGDEDAKRKLAALQS